MDDFEVRNKEMIARMAADEKLQKSSLQWMSDSVRYEYSHHFSWMGRPIIQFPQDILAIQELIWRVKPDLIIETGIARGGSLIFSASILELLGGNGMVLGIDIDIRQHNRVAIEEHPMFKRIKMIEGSSIDGETLKRVADIAKDRKKIMVILDSNHTHEHVLRELELYAPFVKQGSYCIVMDTVIDDLPADPNRTWGKGNSPKSAVKLFLESNKRFAVDKKFENKLLISVAPSGYLECIAN